MKLLLVMTEIPHELIIKSKKSYMKKMKNIRNILMIVNATGLERTTS